MSATKLASPSGLSAEINANGSLRRLDCGPITLSLYLGNELEGGPANLYLRRRREGQRGEEAAARGWRRAEASAGDARAGGPGTQAPEWTPLLGPGSPTRFQPGTVGDRLIGSGEWLGLAYSIALVLARDAAAWFWHVRLENTTSAPQEIDLTYAQDLALAQYWAVRLNEYYVSQYIDHTPLHDAVHGHLVASRQNLAVDGRHPWCLIGSLRSGASFATDALQFYGLAARAGQAPAGLTGDLPARRLQHEHSMTVIRDSPLTLAPGVRAAAGFFGLLIADHPEATSDADLERLNAIRALPEVAAAIEPASPERRVAGTGAAPESRAANVSDAAFAPGAASASGAPGTAGASSATTPATLFGTAPVLDVIDLEPHALRTAFPLPWRHEERDEQGNLLSFFHGEAQHVVLRAKELRVLRPHGQLLRTGGHLTPDETALTSTFWMRGVFHSMLTQGHVSINRLLSTVHSYVGLFRSHGQRVFVDLGDGWRLLDLPSAFEMCPGGGRWLYAHRDGLIEVRTEALSDPHRLSLAIEVRSGAPTRFLIANHLALDGDDGSGPSRPRWWREGEGIAAAPSPGTELGRRFPYGRFLFEPVAGTRWAQVGGDELLFADGRSREQPYLCVVTVPTRLAGLSIRGDLVRADTASSGDEGCPRIAAPSAVGTRGTRSPRGSPALRLALTAPAGSPLAASVSRLADIAPWFIHDALVHYLSPRGLEQYSGGGWGTRDVSQGPVELLLALGRPEPVRDILLRLMRAQNPDGDWPQWFMFFERERDIRAGDSHGDIVFWPLVVLGQYLAASGDAGVLDERVPFFDRRGPDAGDLATVWEHAERALSLIAKRVIPGTALAAYGHGDWNDSLQPADPAMRERLCSAWTVTLHFQMLTALARALRAVGRREAARRLEASAEAVRRDFRSLLIADGVLAGYALFEEGAVRHLLHPRDDRTGVRYSALAMVHAILENLLTPAEARAHLAIIDAHLSGPDGLRLFDRPMSYHGGPQRLFQRAESAAFFGREIGLMYMHAHLRYAQALAHMGEADRFFHALCQANPIGIREIVPAAALRQVNCYYSSSDAAFADRYEASAEYDRVARGTVALEGGWRVYSSGAGIALGLIVRRFLGLDAEADVLRVDPVMPRALDGLHADIEWQGRPFDVLYRVGRAGCGVRRVELNGGLLPFTSEANPHRQGAALIPRAALAERLKEERNRLEIEIG